MLCTNIDQDIAHARAQIKTDNLQPGSPAVKPAGYLDGEVSQISAGKPFHQTSARAGGHAVGPIGVDFVDRPFVATKAECKLDHIVIQPVDISGQGDGATIGKRNFPLGQRQSARLALVAHHH